MVYPSLSDDNNSFLKSNEPVLASVFQRLLSVMLDYFILSPVISFIVVIMFSDGLKLYQQFPDSKESLSIFLQIGMGFVFMFTFLQALFISMAGGTPGQLFTKIFVQFDLVSGQNNEYNQIDIFFRAWLRQIGFVFSIFCMGLPFAAILYHPKRRAIYERMTESSVKTFVKNPVHILNWGVAEKRYVSVFASTFFIFCLGIGVFSFHSMYQKTLASNLTYTDLNKVGHFCSELDSIKQENRLNVAAAMSLAGQLSDRCLNLEADFVLWRDYSSGSQNPKSLAYFAKYLTATDEDTELEYLSQTCAQDTGSEACQIAEAFKGGNFQELLNQKRLKETNLLNAVLKYEITKFLKSDVESSLEDVETYATFKLVKKYIVNEKLSLLGQRSSKDSGRRPASAKQSLTEIEKIQNRVNEL